jgi:hypothetical protein
VPGSLLLQGRERACHQADKKILDLQAVMIEQKVDDPAEAQYPCNAPKAQRQVVPHFFAEMFQYINYIGYGICNLFIHAKNDSNGAAADPRGYGTHPDDQAF